MIRFSATVPSKNLRTIKDRIESFPGINKESITTQSIDDFATDINVSAEADKTLPEFRGLVSFLQNNSIVYSFGDY